jgi:hypothetical protein
MLIHLVIDVFFLSYFSKMVISLKVFAFLQEDAQGGPGGQNVAAAKK